VNFTICTVGSCSQHACFASGEDQVCGTHWKATLEHREAEDVVQSLLTRARDAKTVEELRDVVFELIERTLIG
jgi:hypothetical protein